MHAPENGSKDQTVTLLDLTTHEVRADIEEYEAALARIPLQSENQADMILSSIFSALIRERRAMLDQLYRLEFQKTDSDLPQCGRGE